MAKVIDNYRVSASPEQQFHTTNTSKIKEGISGILKPNGKFIPCDYGKHCTITEQITEEEEKNCIILSSSKKVFNNCKSSTLYLDDVGHCSKEQYKWLELNQNDLDEEQYKAYEEFIKKCKKE